MPPDPPLSAAGRPDPAASSSGLSRADWAGLAALALILICVRLPVILRQIPAQDEDYFAVPGATILKEGIPRIPYMPSRNPAGAFYRADEMLFTLPPAYFYWQAGWYAALGPSTAVARIAALAAGLAALPLLYWLGLRWTGSRFAAGLGVTLYALSRVLMFPCVVARPDMLCGCFGFGALAMAERWHTDRRKRWLVASGALIGGGFLTHPFALVYALQIGLWVCLVSAPMSRRIGRGALLTATSLVVFSLWGILIAQKPELFKRQFFNNVVGQAGPGLPSRVIHPWPAVRAQAVLFGDHAGSIQGGLMVAGLVGLGTILLWRRIISDASPAVLRDGSEAGTGGRDGLFRLWLLGVSSVYFLVICQGQHPTKGYLCYPGGLMFLCLGATVGKFADGLLGRIAGARREGSSANVAGPRVPWLSGVVAALLVAAMLPGSGLRATAVYLRHWNDIDYDAPRFTAALIDRTPANARLIVDPGYIFDFYRSGRDVRLGLIYGFFYDVRGTPYDYVIGGPYSIRDGVPEAVGAEFVEERGDRSDLFACHARIYRAPGAP